MTVPASESGGPGGIPCQEPESFVRPRRLNLGTRPLVWSSARIYNMKRVSTYFDSTVVELWVASLLHSHSQVV